MNKTFNLLCAGALGIGVGYLLHWYMTKDQYVIVGVDQQNNCVEENEVDNCDENTDTSLSKDIVEEDEVDNSEKNAEEDDEVIVVDGNYAKKMEISKGTIVYFEQSGNLAFEHYDDGEVVYDLIDNDDISLYLGSDYEKILMMLEVFDMYSEERLYVHNKNLNTIYEVKVIFGEYDDYV